jgi:hypothetical protein
MLRVSSYRPTSVPANNAISVEIMTVPPNVNTIIQSLDESSTMAGDAIFGGSHGWLQGRYYAIH